MATTDQRFSSSQEGLPDPAVLQRGFITRIDYVHRSFANLALAGDLLFPTTSSKFSHTQNPRSAAKGLAGVGSLARPGLQPRESAGRGESLRGGAAEAGGAPTPHQRVSCGKWPERH